MAGNTQEPGARHDRTRYFSVDRMPVRSRPLFLRLTALVLAVQFTLAPLAAQAQAQAQAQSALRLPALGDSVSETVSLGDERRYGDWIMSQVRGDPLVLDDPLLQAYLESLWQPLLQAARAQGHISDELQERFAWETLLIKERTINASAWPGGYFMFNLGLIAIIGAVIGAVALTVLRRGNTTGGSISPTEARVRAALQDSIIRPRTKELALHAPAMLALIGVLPPWMNNLLLMGSTIGQGSIVDSFAHYHTPLLISLQRTVNGIFFGALIGVAVMIAARVLKAYFEKSHLERLNTERKTS